MSPEALVAIYGPPLVGKTTLAAKLSRSLRMTHINTDDIAWTLAEFYGNDHRKAVVDKVFTTSRRIAVSLVRRQLFNGVSTILDAALPDTSTWTALNQLCELSGARMVAVELTAPLPLLQRRLETYERRLQAFSHTPQTLEETYYALGTIYKDRRPSLTILNDTSLEKSEEAVLHAILEELQ